MQKNKEKLKMLTIRLPAELHQALKLKAVQDDEPIQNLVIEAIKKIVKA